MSDETKTRQTLEDELAALRQQLTDLMHAFQVSPTPIVVARLSDGLIIQANESLARLTGYSRGEAIGKTTVQLGLYVNPADRQRIMAQLEERGEWNDFEVQIRTKTGEIHQVVASAVRLEISGETCLMGTYHDITGRKQMEAALRESEELYRSVVERANDGICIIQDMRVRFLNRRLAEFWGGSADEVIGRPFTDFIHPDASPIVVEAYRSRLAGESVPSTYETSLRSKDGRRLDVEVNAGLITYQGRPADVVIVREIGARKRGEEALRQGQRHLEVALQGADLGWYNWDIQTGEVVINDRYAEMLGYRVEDLRPVLETWEELIHPEDRPPEVEALQREMQPPFPLVETEYRMRCKDGSWRWVLDRGKVVEWDAEGRPLRTAGTHLDVTPRKRAEEERERLRTELVATQKMKAIGQLAAGMAHHFNNLLTSVNGFAELIRLRLPPGDPSSDMADKILISGQRAAELVNQLLAFSSQQMVTPVLLNINSVVRQMEIMLRHMGREHMELVTNLAPNLWPVIVDPAQVRQVIVTLALNARDAMPKGGRLTIETANVVLDDRYAADHPSAQPGPHIRLRISDTGIGMSDEIKQHLFEPFFTTAEAGKGVGLGLPAVYGIVRQNHGFIQVDSQPGHGTVVTIHIPCAPEASGRAGGEGRLAKASPPGGETILVLEDHQAVLELTQQVLQDEGYQVLTASDGHEALALAARHDGSIHLLLTDVVTPGISGREVADRLAAVRPGLRVLYMSGYTGETIRNYRVRETDTAFLPKPFSPADLTRKVREMLDS
jgi:two-component system, cell cycle sensor histidine kinase and response regulator CckA